MKQFIFFILLILTLIQCDFISPDVTYSRPLISAYVTDFELTPPVHFGNEFYRVSGARFRVSGETGVIYDVQYKVYGKVKYCGAGGQEEIDIATDKISIADTLHISSKTVQLGTGIEYLTVPINGAPAGLLQYAGTIGVSIYYRNGDGKKQISKSESYEYFNLYCQ